MAFSPSNSIFVMSFDYPQGGPPMVPRNKLVKYCILIESIFNIYCCEIRLVVFHCNAGRYHAKFCFLLKTRVSHFGESLEAA